MEQLTTQMSVSDDNISDVVAPQVSGSQTSPGVPLMLVSAYQDEQQRHRSQALPKLPSHRFRYSVWHELSATEVRGDQLHAPRVRTGPSIKEELFYKLGDENRNRLHHSRRGQGRLEYTSQMENWEQARVANLSYQELGHNYQMEEFLRVLKRLLVVEQLNIQEDCLVNLQDITFPQCVQLNLSKNYISSFKKLPKLPRVKHLNLDDNNIEDMTGVEGLKKTPIESLSLKRNPVSFTLNYRQR